MDSRFFESIKRNPKIGQIIVSLISHIGISDVEPTLSTLAEIKGYDIPEFISDVYDFLKMYQNKIDIFKDFTFQPQSTYAHLDHDEQNAIRFKVIKRTPATMTQGAAPHTGIKHVKWLLYSICDDVMNPGYKVLVYYKQYDNTLELTSWSKNYRDADLAAYKIEELLDTFSFYFRNKGVLQLHHESREADQLRSTANFDYYGCSLIFYIRTNSIKLVYEKELESLAVNILLSN